MRAALAHHSLPSRSQGCSCSPEQLVIQKHTFKMTPWKSKGSEGQFRYPLLVQEGLLCTRNFQHFQVTFLKNSMSSFLLSKRTRATSVQLCQPIVANPASPWICWRTSHLLSPSSSRMRRINDCAASIWFCFSLFMSSCFVYAFLFSPSISRSISDSRKADSERESSKRRSRPTCCF